MLIFLLLKFCCHIFQQAADRQILGTDSLTFAAFDAVGRFPVAYCMYTVVIKVCTPSLEKFLHIHAGEQIRDRDLFRTSCRTVSAGSTRDIIFFSFL